MGTQKKFMHTDQCFSDIASREISSGSRPARRTWTKLREAKAIGSICTPDAIDTSNIKEIALRRHLPSMKALQAFEAASRYLNFTRAGLELNLTQTAVSHQIRNLEETLGAKLFNRGGVGLSLTPAGENYLAVVRLVISEISLATDRASDEAREDVLTIGCLGTFQIKVLLPAIEQFRDIHPAISIRLKTLVPNAAPARPDYDVAIQYGVGNWHGVFAYKLSDEEVFPVCSPLLLEREPGLSDPADLQHQTIIRTRSPLLVRDDWPFWMEAAGIGGVTFTREINCDLLYPAFQAAIEGLGVVMGRSAAVTQDIRQGKLVEPFSIRISSPSAYYMLVPHGRETENKVIAFRDWFLDYMQKSTG